MYLPYGSISATHAIQYWNPNRYRYGRNQRAEGGGGARENPLCKIYTKFTHKNNTRNSIILCVSKTS